MQTTPQQRASAFAKLLRYGDALVVAMLERDDNDALTIALTLWVPATDEQLRVVVAYPSMSDEVIQLLFNDFGDEALAMTLEEMKIPQLLAAVSADG
jgi:hypothetical protein